MVTKRHDRAVSGPPPARDIIDAVVDNMRKNLEPLKYSDARAQPLHRLLHPAEFARLEGIIPSAGADDRALTRSWTS